MLYKKHKETVIGVPPMDLVRMCTSELKDEIGSGNMAEEAQRC